MSYSTDVLLFATPGDPGIEQLREKIAASERFDATLYPVDTDGFSGPNVFAGAVLAFGADYWSYFGDEHQELLDSVRWRRPGTVVLIIQREDNDVTEVYRPAFRLERGGHFNAETRAVQGTASTEVTD